MCGRDAPDDLASRFRGLWRGWWVWPPSPSSLPTGPPSPGGGVVGLNAVPNHGSGPSGRWSHGLGAERGIVYHLTTSHRAGSRVRAGCGSLGSSAWGRGPGCAPGRAGAAGGRACAHVRASASARQSKFRPGVCAGLDPFSAHQFPALPICS